MERFTSHIGVFKAGYEWVPRDAKVDQLNRPKKKPLERILVPVGIENFPYDRVGYRIGADNYRWYDAFKSETALFRELASVPVEEEAVQQFANRYGNLLSIADSWELTVGNLKDWEETILWLREGTRLVEEYLNTRSTSRRNAELAQKLKSMLDLVIVNHSMGLRLVEEKGAFVFSGHTRTLQSVVRLQLLLSLVERKTYRTCVHCGKPFEVSPAIGRSDRTHCGQMCRVKAYQRRRKQAEMMRADGVALRDIARELETNMQTVKGWVKDVNPKEKK